MGSNPNPKLGREEEAQPWKPNELEVDPERQERLKQMMEVSMKTIESSQFYTLFLKQLKSPEVSELFRRVLGNETQLHMVIYGIGKIESEEASRFQLSIALLMKREFDWVGENIQVFDPILSATECSVIESLGCTVLYVNEHARREVLKPTLFFMPFCDATLYNNLLLANWRIDRLSRMVLFGNSFKAFEEDTAAYPPFYPKFMNFIKPMIDARKIITEFVVETTTYEYFGAFDLQSWHFFSPGYRYRAANAGLRGILDDNKDADLVYFQSNKFDI